MTMAANCGRMLLGAAMLCVAVVAASVERSRAQGAGLDAEFELVDPKVLRVCADPRNLPFSNEKGEGFENKIAELLAAKLDKKLAYVWYPQATGFVRNTLGAHRCDLIPGFPQGDELVQSTNPYYRTAYALVIRPGTGLDDLDRLTDPRLKDKAHRHRGRHAAGHLSRRQWPDAESQALSAGHRYPRRFLGAGDDARPRQRRDRRRRPVGTDGRLLREAGEPAHAGRAVC